MNILWVQNEDQTFQNERRTKKKSWDTRWWSMQPIFFYCFFSLIFMFLFVSRLFIKCLIFGLLCQSSYKTIFTFCIDDCHYTHKKCCSSLRLHIYTFLILFLCSFLFSSYVLINIMNICFWTMILFWICFFGFFPKKKNERRVFF